MDNMKLWNQVCETDPRWTKLVTLGPRRFTAIDAQKQIKLATELWGPYGGKWGVKDLDWGYVWGKEGEPPLSITLDAVFYYPLEWEQVSERTGEQIQMGATNSFQISSDMAWKVNGDCRKKLLTDLTTKALSKLGFNSDVFEGKFDDNQYVEEMRLRALEKDPGSTPHGDTTRASAEILGLPDKNKDRFMAAVDTLMDAPQFRDDIFVRILGSMGYESSDEVIKEVDRRTLINRCREEMGINKEEGGLRKR